MSKFLIQQGERLKNAFREIFLQNPELEKTQIPTASSPPTEAKPRKEPTPRTPKQAGKNTFGTKLTFGKKPNSKGKDIKENGTPNSSSEQPGKSANNPGIAQTDIKSKLSKFQAHFEKYLCSFKTRKYEWDHTTLMSEAEEAKATHFAVELFACLTESLAPALREFLASKGLHPRNSIIDGYQYLKIMKNECKKNADFLSEGGANGLPLQHLETAHKGRNCVCHGALPEILKEWHIFLHSWIEILNIINAPAAAEKIKKVHDRLTSAEMQYNTEDLPDVSLETFDEKADNEEPVGRGHVETL
ncbi:hypothetical protein GHT06_010774 [Daphnia sinensis]|uniref:Uncharacterized protein n=1 Tax=Daphnia sinensis TaxID=1820382 RepID=A0AAD5KYZ7_9CRUS|nr:hypothetical protein GHT06_010774 [Daphnia sinensis]